MLNRRSFMGVFSGFFALLGLGCQGPKETPSGLPDAEGLLPTGPTESDDDVIHCRAVKIPEARLFVWPFDREISLLARDVVATTRSCRGQVETNLHVGSLLGPAAAMKAFYEKYADLTDLRANFLLLGIEREGGKQGWLLFTRCYLTVVGCGARADDSVITSSVVASSVDPVRVCRPYKVVANAGNENSLEFDTDDLPFDVSLKDVDVTACHGVAYESAEDAWVRTLKGVETCSWKVWADPSRGLFPRADGSFKVFSDSPVRFGGREA